MQTIDEKIASNRTFAHLLGWALSDFGATAFNPSLIQAIAAQQALLNIDVDGVAGPNTYKALLRTMQSHLLTHPSNDRLRDAGVIAFCEAKIVWLGDVQDLPAVGTDDYERDRQAIDSMIRTTAGLNWSWQTPYRKNFEWCGAFDANAWRKANLRQAIRTSFLASTYRLDRYAHYQPMESTLNPKPDHGPYRMVIELDEKSTPAMVVFEDGTWPREGDIMMMGMAHSAYGTHISIVEDFDPGTGMFTTLEGNGTGLSPKGSRQHGVVRAFRPTGIASGMSEKTYHARRVIRPALADLA